LSNIDLSAWIGRTETRPDVISAGPVARLAATLDRSDLTTGGEGDVLPPLWHWLYFLPDTPGAGLGEDGHAKRGGFLPPVPLPRRMWAGSRVTFHRPLRIGDPLTRTSLIRSVDERNGRSGPLVIMTLSRTLAGPRGLAITKEQDIVYREAAKPGAPATAAAAAARVEKQRSRLVMPSEPLLLRYSALTFNAHRIHYDREYATRVEGYPALVVQGPLIATLLLDFVSRERPTAKVSRFEFKAVSPLFDGAAFEVCLKDAEANRLQLRARNPAGGLAMQASAELG
jgi:3-methylfumaryl-CoA hydratase